LNWEDEPVDWKRILDVFLVIPRSRGKFFPHSDTFQRTIPDPDLYHFLIFGGALFLMKWWRAGSSPLLAAGRRRPA
jgi:hypothetical protein